jgi:hypothetical protein
LEATAAPVASDARAAALAVLNTRLPNRQQLGPEDLEPAGPPRVYQAVITRHFVLIRGGDSRFDNVTDARLPVTRPIRAHHRQAAPQSRARSRNHDEQARIGRKIDTGTTYRAGTDGAIGVGGATLATQLLRARLLDELLLCTPPATLGFGRPLFDDYEVPIELDLLEQRSFKQGVTMHRYAIRDGSEASPC